MPFFVLSMEGVLRGLDRRLEDAARTLGATRWTVFRRVTLPLVRPSIAAGAALCWARALGEFGATITFAGNFAGRTQTIPLAVYVRPAKLPAKRAWRSAWSCSRCRSPSWSRYADAGSSSHEPHGARPRPARRLSTRRRAGRGRGRDGGRARS